MREAQTASELCDCRETRDGVMMRAIQRTVAFAAATQPDGSGRREATRHAMTPRSAKRHEEAREECGSSSGAGMPFAVSLVLRPDGGECEEEAEHVFREQDPRLLLLSSQRSGRREASKACTSCAAQHTHSLTEAEFEGPNA